MTINRMIKNIPMSFLLSIVLLITIIPIFIFNTISNIYSDQGTSTFQMFSTTTVNGDIVNCDWDCGGDDCTPCLPIVENMINSSLTSSSKLDTNENLTKPSGIECAGKGCTLCDPITDPTCTTPDKSQNKSLNITKSSLIQH